MCICGRRNCSECGPAYTFMPTTERLINKRKWYEWERELISRRSIEHKCKNRRLWTPLSYIYEGGNRKVGHYAAMRFESEEKPEAPLILYPWFCPWCGEPLSH